MIEARCLTVYAGGELVVKCASFSVGPGELAVLYGPTGGGKSSIVKALAGIYRYSGEVRLKRPYFIFQDVDFNLLFAYTDEEARSVACRPAERREIAKMSPGQRQLFAVRLALESGASAVVLDEPLAFLDPASALEVAEAIKRLRDRGLGVLVAEHRLEFFLDADRFYLVDGGVEELGLEDLLIEASRRGYGPYFTRRSFKLPAAPRGEGCGVELGGRPYPPGSKIALTGPVGSGKTHTLYALAGVVKKAGVRGCRPAGFVPQNPYLYFGEVDLSKAPREVLEWLGLGPGDSPLRLSYGEARLLAVLWELWRRPRLLLLDEPTAGVDRRYAEAVGELISAYGGTVVFATHDPVFAERYGEYKIRLG
ncbi:ribose ABC transporter, ATP-binding protein, putative [Pyrobaculum ferrireducens]|uniref:Ribose ABC transporter, ATP-binding protein, putative n=1 Tax=Pyrobaculum ferrireducens TaxID=1104324 RepID=G7VII5_9CREN|nr:ribose ABC transporter, ATP-binding protein, putative [Pyrobaculum ferrireducens]